MDHLKTLKTAISFTQPWGAFSSAHPRYARRGRTRRKALLDGYHYRTTNVVTPVSDGLLGHIAASLLLPLFGNLKLRSPRWNHRECQPHHAKTFSPLLGLLNEHVSPERLYLETKWASLISFELAADLLKDTLQIPETVNAAGVRNHLHRVAERAEALAQRGSDCDGLCGIGSKPDSMTHSLP